MWHQEGIFFVRDGKYGSLFAGGNDLVIWGIDQKRERGQLLKLFLQRQEGLEVVYSGGFTLR